MLRPASPKSKPPPWIPAGRGMPPYRRPPMPAAKNKSEDPVSSKMPPKTTMDILKEETNKDLEPDSISVSSHSSCEAQHKPDIHHISVLQDMKLTYIHFASLRSSYLTAHRLIDSLVIEDSSINELFTEAEVCMKKLNELFEDLEYSVSVLENTFSESQKMAEYSTVFKNKEKLLSRLFDMYEKVILIYQTVFEKQDYKELTQQQDSLSRKLQLTEKKSISQEAIIRDLERKLSIFQSKTSTMESYKTNLESAKAELEKQVLYKDSQIKYLNNELLNASGKTAKSDHEEYIAVIESIKQKAHTEKSALKKALKFLKIQSVKNEEQCQKLMQESNEKEKMMYDIAAQRDQLKVQLTVVNNNIIQQKNQIEEIKLQNLKLQNEMTEKNISHKKELTELKSTLEEKSSELDKSLKAKAKLKETIEELENELKKSKEQLKTLKEETAPQSTDLHDVQVKSKETDFMHEEIQHLVSLLQNTKELFENLKHSSHVVSAAGDHATTDAEFNHVQNEILAVVKETKDHLLELKNLYKAFQQEQKEVPEQEDPHKKDDSEKKNDLEKELKKMEQLYSEAKKENETLKKEVEELKSSSLANPVNQKSENHFASHMSNDNVTRKLQVELLKKSDEILSMKYDFKQKEKNLEDQLREFKDKLRTAQQLDNTKISNLEEELKSTRLELSILHKKKDEETERLLQRSKELQDSLDIKSAEYERLERYVQLLKSSYFNVFYDS